MYNVIKDLMNINSLIILDFSKHEIECEIPMKGITTTFLDKTLVYPLKKNFKKAEHYYNNIELTGGQLKGKLQILQDYGDNEGANGDGENIFGIPKFLVIPEFNPSIGWYDNHICYICPFKHKLFIVKLSEHQEIDLKSLRCKRPYNSHMYFKADDPDKYIYIDISISYSKYNEETQKFDDNYDRIIYKTDFKWENLSNPYYISKVVYEFYQQPEWVYKDSKNYITADYLMSLGFSLVNNGESDEGKSYWKKGNLRIYTNTLKSPNDYYWVNNKNFFSDKAKFIFRKSELHKWMKGIKV